MRKIFLFFLLIPEVPSLFPALRAEQSIQPENAVGGSRAASGSSWMASVRALLAERDYAGAAGILEKVSSEQQGNYAFLNLIGATLERAGQNEKANALYQKALEGRPDSATVRLNLAVNYARLKQYDRASVQFTRLLKEDSLQPTREATYQQSPDDEAMGAFVAAIPARERDWYELGMLFLRHARPRGAESIFRSAGIRFPASALLQYGLGVALQECGRFQDARQAFVAAMQLERPYVEAALRLGYTHYALGEYAEAIRVYKEVVESQPKSYEAHYFLALAFAMSGASARDSAVEHFRQAIDLNPGSFDSHAELGRIFLETGKLAEAKTEFEIAARLNPDQEKIHYLLSRTYRRLGENGAADRELQIFEKLKRQSYERSTELMQADLLPGPEDAGSRVAEEVAHFIETYKSILLAQDFLRLWQYLTPSSQELYDNDSVQFVKIASKVYATPEMLERIKLSRLQGGRVVAGRILCEFSAASGEKIPPLVLVREQHGLRIDYAFEWTTAGLGYLGAR